MNLLQFGSSRFCRGWIFLASLLLALVATERATVANPNGEEQQLRKFEQTRALDSIKDVVPDLQLSWFHLLETKRLSGRNIPVSDRRALTLRWARLFATLQIAIDPKFDVNDPSNQSYSESLTPPKERDGTIEPSGVAPEDVKDPVARKKYIVAIARNNEKALRFEYQSRLAYAYESARIFSRGMSNLFIQALLLTSTSCMTSLAEPARAKP